ncbi:MAG: acyl carrier protein [Stenotrophobium sp.]
MQNREEIYTGLRDILVELFEIDPAKITLDANLYQDLEIDSIDAVDLVIKLKEVTGKKMQAEEFKQVRTVGDVVNAVYDLLHAAPTPAP